jgi:3-hydroxybutyryl-CoA dehydrogenase
MHKAISVTVIGAGLMGHGIGQVFARAGHAVVITDPNAAILNVALERVEANLVSEGVEAQRVLCNMRIDETLQSAVAQADLVIEAAPEKLELKQKLFADVAAAAPKHAVLASNTSVIPITRIGEALEPQARARLVGTHWWNPPHLVPLVEVVRTAYTCDEVFEQTFAWLAAAGKCPVRVQHDVTGFIGNRLQHALWREAIALVEDGVCDAESIDLVVKNSFGMRMPVLGPMENADLVGLELTRDVHRVMFPDLKCDKAPSPLLGRLIEKGSTGMKAGQGLRAWTPEQAQAVHARLAAHLIRMTRD